MKSLLSVFPRIAGFGIVFLLCLLQIGTTEADLLNLSPGQVADTGTRRATTVGHVERGGTGCRLCFRCAGASASRSKLSRLASGADSYGCKLYPHCCWQLRIKSSTACQPPVRPRDGHLLLRQLSRAITIDLERRLPPARPRKSCQPRGQWQCRHPV